MKVAYLFENLLPVENNPEISLVDLMVSKLNFSIKRRDACVLWRDDVKVLHGRLLLTCESGNHGT